MADPRGSHHTDRGLRASGGAARWQRWRRQKRVGERAFSRIGHWRVHLKSGYWKIRSPLSVQQSQMYHQLTLSHGTGGRAPLRTHTIHGLLPRDGHCRRQSHLVWRVGLNFKRSSSAQSLGVALARGGKWLSVIGGLGLVFHTAGRWWAGPDERIHGAQRKEKHRVKHGNKMEGRRRGDCSRSGLLSERRRRQVSNEYSFFYSRTNG